jgi:branched-chain amino acid transport system ATP-binding protein
MSDPAAALLEVESLSMRFGGLVAVDDLSFTARAREITAIIGPNGAGKTTLFNCLTGFYHSTAGKLSLHHPVRGLIRLERMEGFRVAAQAGVVRTFQNVRLFPRMTVLENLIVAQHTALMRASLFSFAGLLGLRRYRRVEAEAVERARFWLERLQLVARADDPAGALPYGAQRRVEIARAMCARPVLLCLDEPAAGLNPRESSILNELLVEIREREQIGILLIEHDMSVVMGVSDQIIVLDHGKRIAAGPPELVRRDPTVIKAYLGEEEDAALPPEIAADLSRREPQ